MLTNRSIEQENNKTKSQPNFAPKKKNSIQNGDPSNPRIICRRFIPLCIALFLRTILFTFFRCVIFVRFCVLSPEAAISVCVSVCEDTHRRRRDAQRTDTLRTGGHTYVSCTHIHTDTQTHSHIFTHRVIYLDIHTYSHTELYITMYTQKHIHTELYIKMYTHSHTYTNVSGDTKIIHILFSYRPHQER